LYYLDEEKNNQQKRSKGKPAPTSVGERGAEKQKMEKTQEGGGGSLSTWFAE